MAAARVYNDDEPPEPQDIILLDQPIKMITQCAPDLDMVRRRFGIGGTTIGAELYNPAGFSQEEACIIAATQLDGHEGDERFKQNTELGKAREAALLLRYKSYCAMHFGERSATNTAVDLHYCGFAVHPVYRFLRASPDAITHKHPSPRIVQAKFKSAKTIAERNQRAAVAAATAAGAKPVAPVYTTPLDAHHPKCQKKGPCDCKCPTPYMNQVFLEMFCSGRRRNDVVIGTDVALVVFTIQWQHYTENGSWWLDNKARIMAMYDRWLQWYWENDRSERATAPLRNLIERFNLHQIARTKVDGIVRKLTDIDALFALQPVEADGDVAALRQWRMRTFTVERSSAFAAVPMERHNNAFAVVKHRADTEVEEEDGRSKKKQKKAVASLYHPHELAVIAQIQEATGVVPDVAALAWQYAAPTIADWDGTSMVIDTLATGVCCAMHQDRLFLIATETDCVVGYINVEEPSLRFVRDSTISHADVIRHATDQSTDWVSTRNGRMVHLSPPYARVWPSKFATPEHDRVAKFQPEHLKRSRRLSPDAYTVDLVYIDQTVYASPFQKRSMNAAPYSYAVTVEEEDGKAAAIRLSLHEVEDGRFIEVIPGSMTSPPQMYQYRFAVDRPTVLIKTPLKGPSNASALTGWISSSSSNLHAHGGRLFLFTESSGIFVISVTDDSWWFTRFGQGFGRVSDAYMFANCAIQVTHLSASTVQFSRFSIDTRFLELRPPPPPPPAPVSPQTLTTTYALSA